jgi:hypothetical protein
MRSGLVLAGGLIVSVWFFVAVRQPGRSGDVVQAQAAVTGRYQVVNGTPEIARNIMLLDTVTGDSWILCVGVNDETTWCKIPRSDGTASPKK